MFNHSKRVVFSAVCGLAMGATGCVGASMEGASADEASSSQADAIVVRGGAPVAGDVIPGVGAAGIALGALASDVTAKWGSPSRCWTRSGAARPVTETCEYRSADGVLRASITLAGAPKRVASLGIPFNNGTWKTARGIHVGSTAVAFNAAYGSAIDATRSTYYSKAVIGAGSPGVTRFVLGWINEYQADQYFGVVSLSIAPN